VGFKYETCGATIVTQQQSPKGHPKIEGDQSEHRGEPSSEEGMNCEAAHPLAHLRPSPCAHWRSPAGAGESGVEGVGEMWARCKVVLLCYQRCLLAPLPTLMDLFQSRPFLEHTSRTWRPSLCSMKRWMNDTEVLRWSRS
jgi:hypothetical protein